jgi:hypothetical protein
MRLSPTEHEGRTAFVLAFGRAIPLKIHVDKHTTENVSVLFCGTPDSPLLVQRTDHAVLEEMVGAGLAGSSGAAAAAPRLGYVLGCGPTDDMDKLTRSQALADQKVGHCLERRDIGVSSRPPSWCSMEYRRVHGLRGGNGAIMQADGNPRR